jgi:cobalamin-dependent methionine synthase I
MHTVVVCSKLITHIEFTDGICNLVCVFHVVVYHRVGEDVVLFKDAERTEKAAAFCMLRQQVQLDQ